MAATADPREKPPTRHLEPWGHQQAPHAHRVPPVRHAVTSASSLGGAADDTLDRRRSTSHRRGPAAAAAAAVVVQVVDEEPYDGGIEELRVKLMGHLRDAAERLRLPQPSPLLPPPPPPKAVVLVPSPDTKEPEPEPKPELRAPPPPPPPTQQQQVVDVADRPWKLRERTRRRPAALTSWAGTAAAASSRRRRRVPFSVSLAPEEIEEDIYALTGGRPRRRPKKRPRVVQRQLDSLFPGLWLTEITADAYRVQDD